MWIDETETVFNNDSIDIDFRVESNGNANMIFVDGGSDHVNIGTSTDLGGTLNVSGNGWFLNTDNTDNITLESTDADASVGPRLRLFRNSGSPADNDVIGDIRWEGKDSGGNDFMYANQKVTIHQEADGSEEAMMQFYVSLAGSSINVLTLDRASTIFNEDSNDIDFRVESNGNANMFFINGGDDTACIGGTNTGNTLFIENQSASETSIFEKNGSASDATVHQLVRSNRAANSAYTFLAGESANGGDREVTLRGDGNAFIDGTFSDNGADYAEFFETKDGNSIDVGKTVVLDNGKVRASTDSDAASTILGVVRPKEDGINSMIIGNTAWNKWHNKYIQDDYGRFTMEEYTATEWKDAEGQTHSYETDKIPGDVTVPDDAVVVVNEHNDSSKKLLRKKLNPDFNDSKTYTPRSDRDEWVIIGMLGQIQIAKGQKTGDRWIKMRDISDSVEEWLVR